MVDYAQRDMKEEKMFEWMQRFHSQPEPTELALYMEQDALDKRAAEARQSAIGAKCVYRVPQADGRWLQIEGEIVRVTDTALVVKDKHFGVRQTIDPGWFVSFVWQRTAAATAETMTVA